MSAASRPPRPPSRHFDASDAPEDFSSLTRWTTTNSDMQFNPAEHSDPSWRPDHLDDPIAERARRRSQIAEPAGTGEFAVGGWAGVPRMRLGGSDPLGGPDRGRAGVEWGTAHFERTLGESLVVDPAATTAPVAHRDGGAVEDMLATVARDAWSGKGSSSGAPKPWETRGVHPSRRRQSPGGADVVSGLWATSSTSYGGFTGDTFKPPSSRNPRTKAHAAQYEAQATAPIRAHVVLSNAAFNGFLTDEGQSAEVKDIIRRQREEAQRAAEADGVALGAREMAMLRREARKLNVAGLEE